MSGRKGFVLGVIVGGGVLAGALAGVSLAARDDDGGSGSYSGSGTTLTFTVVNSGTTDWQYIVFKLPPGSSFVKGEVTGGSPPCTVGAFVPGSGELECGGFSPAVPPNGKVTVTVMVDTAVVPCGSPIQFWVNSTGVPPYKRVSDLTFSGSCGKPPKNCDKERIAVAAAKGRVAGAKEVLRDETARLKVEEEDLKEAETRLKNFAMSHSVSEILNDPFLSGALNALSDEVSKADSSVTFEKLLQFSSRNELVRAEAELAKAEQALASCEGGLSRSLAHTQSIDALEACSSEQDALAGAQARAKELGVGVRQLERAKLRAAEKALHAGIAKLTTALAKPAASKYRPELDPVLALLRQADSIMIGAVHKLDRLEKSAKTAAASVPKAKAALAKCQATPPPPTVSISEDDTWAYNRSNGKGNVCLNVRTTPAQASVSATLDGPSGYHAHLDKTPLDPGGTIQIKAAITVGGDYTKTLTVYDASGSQTATVTKTFTVAASPQDGPATTPDCPKPT